MALSKALSERSSSEALHTCDGHTTMGLLVCLCRTARERRFRLTHCPPEMLLGQSGVGTCLPVGKCIVLVGNPCERLAPRSPVCDSNSSMKSKLQSLHTNTQVLQMPLYGPFCKPIRVFLPSAEILVQNLPPYTVEM